MRNVICLSIPVQSQTDELKICVTEVNPFDFTLEMNEALHYRASPPAERLCFLMSLFAHQINESGNSWCKAVCTGNAAASNAASPVSHSSSSWKGTAE